ncbi:MAG: VTT domain-containing protein [Patescibacteria group bacterium]
MTKTLSIALGIFVLLLVLSVFLYINDVTREYLTSDTLLRESVERFGIFAPLVVILYHIVQVIIAPIPGQPADIATGYLLGPYIGIPTSLIGIYLGSLIAIILARRFGRPLVDHLVPRKAVSKVDHFLGKRSMWFYIILFIIPISPGDLLCFALGLTKMPIWRTLVVIILGRTPVAITAVLVGASGRYFSPLEFLGIAGIVVIVFLALVRILPLKRIERFHFWTN